MTSDQPMAKRAPAGAADAVAALLRQAQALHQQGRLAEARAGYEAVLARDPRRAEALHLAGVIEFQTGRMEEGAALVRRAIAIQPNVAAPHANLGQALIHLGRFAEAAEALGRAVALQPANGQAHNGRGLALHRLGRLDDAVQSFDQAIRLNPADPAAYVNAANALADGGRLQEALARLEAALRLRPDLFEALTSRAIVLQQLGRPDAALADMTRAARLRPTLAGVRYNLGSLLNDLRRPAEALAEFDAAIRLEPGHLTAIYSRGVALAELGRGAEAIAAFDRAIALKPDYAEALYARALSRLQQGDFEGGLRDYERRKALTPPLGLRAYREPEWRGDQDLAGKVLFLHHEQGFGDTLMACRYAKLARARGAEVVLGVQAPLTRLMRTLDPEIRVIGPDERPARFDLHAPLMSLPLAFGTTVETIPAEPRYLASDDALRAAWAARLPPAAGRRRIGLVWASNRQNRQLAQRSAGLAAAQPLLQADAQWISLQKDPAPGEAEAFAALGGLPLGDDLEDFADTAAVIDLLDLVITVDTSVAHLAGALGRPVYILLAFNADWRWLTGRSDSPWHPSARLFRQPAPGDWANVVREVEAAISV